MEKSSKNKLGLASPDFVLEARNFLMAETTILYGITKSRKLKNRAKNISSMICTLLSTINAIIILSKENQIFYSDCVILSRCFFEKTTNICYLLLCDENTYNKCMAHTIFRQYLRNRDSNKTIKNEQNEVLSKIGFRQEGIDRLKKDKKFQKIFEEFEKSKKTKFPLPKIEKRLGFLTKFPKYINAQIFLLYQLSYYDDASEALHGTLYGSLFHILNANSMDKIEVKNDVNRSTSLFLLQTGGIINQLIQLLNKDNDLQDFWEKSEFNSKTITESVKTVLTKNHVDNKN